MSDWVYNMTGQVPLYAAENNSYSGPASAQMIRDGYPKKPIATSHYYKQDYLWNIIQVNNSIKRVDAQWVTDPQGLGGCLKSLNNPSGVRWIVVQSPSRNTVLWDILFYMNIFPYACAVPINNFRYSGIIGGYWVVIVGFITDMAPIQQNAATITLKEIDFYSPAPVRIGSYTIMAAAQWFSGPWKTPVTNSGTWKDCYIAIIDPPKERGTVIVKEVARTGKNLLSSAQALEAAQNSIKDMELAERSMYHFLKHKELINLEPILVREEMPDSKDRAAPYYYIVPFGLKGEYTELKEQASRVCVLVNAYTGQFEEATTFGKAVRFLPKTEALKIVTGAMGLEKDTPKGIETTMMFQPSGITNMRSWPFWSVKIGKRTVYVDQSGNLYGNLLSGIPGD